jgi:hypothetical protein
MGMGNLFAVALTESGRVGTVFFNEEPKAGDVVNYFYHDEIGLLQNGSDKLVKILTDNEYLRMLRGL